MAFNLKVINENRAIQTTATLLLFYIQLLLIFLLIKSYERGELLTNPLMPKELLILNYEASIQKGLVLAVSLPIVLGLKLLRQNLFGIVAVIAIIVFYYYL